MKTKFYLNQWILAFVFLAFALPSNAQLYVKMADSAEVWSDPQQFTYRDRTGIEGTVEVSVKWLKRKSTTCFYEVKITNVGSTEFRGCFELTANEKGALACINAINTNLKPGYYVSQKLEMRECWPKGAKGMSDIQRCSACNPKLYFSGSIIR